MKRTGLAILFYLAGAVAPFWVLVILNASRLHLSLWRMMFG